MQKDFRKQLSFVKGEAGKCVDPTIRIAAAYDCVETCFESPKFNLRPGSEELLAARDAVGWILLSVRALSRLMRRFFGGLGPEEWEFDKVSASLSNNHVRGEDVVAAMDFLHGAIRDMLELFRRATFDSTEFELEILDYDDEDPYCSEIELEDEDAEEWARGVYWEHFEFARHKCAALLPILLEKMEKVWVPVKNKISKASTNAS